MDSFAYVFIKLVGERARLMTPEDLAALDQVKTFRDLVAKVREFYPSLGDVETLVDLEKALYEDFFVQFSRIVNASPDRWRQIYLRILAKYELENLKKIVLGVIANLPMGEIRALLYEHVEEILGHEKIVTLMLNQKTVEELLFVLKGYPFAKPLQEGLAHYQSEGEVFQFQAYVDRYYFQLLKATRPHLHKACAKVWETYVGAELERYNLIVLHRGLFNKLAPEFVRGLLVPGGNFLRHADYLEALVKVKHDALRDWVVSKFLERGAKPRLVEEAFKDEPNPEVGIWNYYNLFFSEWGRREYDLERRTFITILHFLKMKESNINHVLRVGVKLVHEINLGVMTVE
ncbi:MAG: hypothetical protein Kow0069_30880 [Promethearchaeota archaeon]